MIPVRLYVYAGIALVGILIAAWAYNAVWQRGYNEAHAELTKVLNEERAAVQAERDEFERKARAAEDAHQASMDAIAAQREQDRINGQAEHNRLVADLRAGNVQLHARWSAAVATADLSNAVQSAAERDAAARDREASAARVIAAARDADDQIRQLQAVIRADRGIQQ